VRTTDVLADPLPDAGLALANLTFEGVTTVAARVPAAELVASGYLAGQQPSPEGWEHVERREAEGWAADLFLRRSEATI
jgi:hypothetical protein